MEDRKTNPTKDELIAQLATPGWTMKTDRKDASAKDQTLEDVVRTAHSKHVSGEEHGAISHLQNAIELDLIQLQLLWEHLGLPM